MARLYAYIYIDPLTNVPFYVGKGSRDRATSHMAPSAKTNVALRSKLEKLKKVGLKPIISIIRVSTHDAAFAIERFLVAIFGKKCDKSGDLYNLSDGGDGPHNLVRSEEAKRKTSESLLKFYQTHEHKQTPEAIAKMKLTKSLRPTGTGKWMNNGTVQTKVKLDDVEAKTNDGWVLGTLKKHVSDEYRAKLREAALNQWQRQKENKQ